MCDRLVRVVVSSETMYLLPPLLPPPVIVTSKLLADPPRPLMQIVKNVETLSDTDCAAFSENSKGLTYTATVDHELERGLFASPS